MKLIAPLYYKNFKCIADKCPHSCCIGWRISVDEESEEKYNSLDGCYSDEIRASICKDDEGAFFRCSASGRCTHLDENGLCKIQKNYGEEMLSEICREHPRYYNRIGDDIAVGVGASCPVAAELILSGELSLYTEAVGEIESDLPEGWQVEAFLKSLTPTIEETSSGDPCGAILTELMLPLDIADPILYKDIFSSLEYLYPENRERIISALSVTPPGGNINAMKRLLSYFLFRHIPKSESRTDSEAISVFAVLSTRIVLSMSRNIPLEEALVSYSEEIEYSTDNTDAIVSEISFSLI